MDEETKEQIKDVLHKPRIPQTVMNVLHKPWAPATIVGVLGVGVGIGAARTYFTRKVKEVTTEAEEDIQQLKNVQLDLDFERSERDHQLNSAIDKATYLTRELTLKGTILLERLQGLSEQGEELPQPELPVDNEPIRVVDPLERMDQRNTAKLISTGEKVAEMVVSNIFSDISDDDWDYEYERSTRTEDEPYIIHVDEFVSDEMGWDSQSTITWYEGDQILTDTHDTPIYNPTSVVGELRFGHGSKDPNVVYVRNEKLQAEYEILRDEGNYMDEVLGGQVERELEASDLRHTNSPRKFRQE